MEALELTHFVQAVYDMRKAQKDYYLLQTNARMKEAKGREERVDVWLKKLVAAGAIKPDGGNVQSTIF